MMNTDSREKIPSFDIEKRRKALKARIYDYKKKGYNISRFSELIEGDIAIAEEAFIDFLNDVHRLEEMENRFYRMDTTGFEREAKEIEAMLKDPDRIPEIEEAIVSLEEKIRRRKMEMESGAVPSSEEELQKELERIREEELRRIREEEAERLREQERKRILQEELERIRNEEEEKLRKSELERIRNEERERLVWEERVMRQLRQIKKKTKEKNQPKTQRCPACGAAIPITSSKRPLKIRCPECGRNYTLKAKGELRENGRKSEPKVKYKKCPKCGSPIPVISEKRPLKIICQNCGAEYILKGKKDEASAVKRAVRKDVSNKPSIDELINPPLPIKPKSGPTLEIREYGDESEISSPHTMKCPTCGREIPADAKICGYCGTPIEEEDRKMGMKKDETSAGMIRCSGCGRDIPADAKICGYCGRPVKKEEDIPPFQGMDDMELPTAPVMPPTVEIKKESFEEKMKFQPLSEYNLQNEPELPSVEQVKQTPSPLTTETQKSPGGPDMIVCPKCGNFVPRGAKFCGICGNPM